MPILEAIGLTVVKLDSYMSVMAKNGSYPLGHPKPSVSRFNWVKEQVPDKRMQNCFYFLPVIYIPLWFTPQKVITIFKIKHIA